MASTGNGSTQQLETLAQVAMANPPGGAVEDFLSRVESAAQLLADVGRELGNAGSADERELLACADQYRADMARIVEKILARHQRRVGDLKRVLGELK
jgi:hypothetical protein